MDIKLDIKYRYKQLLENLYESKNGLQLYTIHRRFNLKPSLVVEFLNEYSSKGIISIRNDSTVELTPEGRDDFRKIISTLFEDEGSINNGYLNKRLFIPMDKFAPYIPSDILTVEMNQPPRLLGDEVFDVPF